jgi:hypothetical protein
MRRTFLGILLLVLAAGCAPSAAPSLAVPSSGACAGIPYIDPDSPPDSLPLTPDPLLEQKLPAQIDGQPVNDISSGRYVETLCMLGGEASLDAALTGAPADVDLNTVSVASASGSVDGLNVTLSAYRLPGKAGDALIPVIGLLSASVGGQPKFAGDGSQQVLGGKQVMTWTDAADGSTSYLYSTGDTLFVVEDVTDSQAGKIFAALP